MKKLLDHRFLSVKKCIDGKKKPKDAIELELYTLLSGGSVSEEVRRAYDIYTHAYKREVIESFLLVGASPTEIQEILRVPESVTEAYAFLFFDNEVFEDELDKLDYSRTYDKDAYGQNLKQFAIDLGKESLKIKMSRGTYNINACEVQDGIRSTAYLMGQMVRVNHMDSQIAREALRWAQLGLRAATEGDTKQEKADIDKMLFELEARDETVNADNSGIEQDEIIH